MIKAWGTSNSLWSLENDSLNIRLFLRFGGRFTHKVHMFFKFVSPTDYCVWERELGISWAILCLFSSLVTAWRILLFRGHPIPLHICVFFETQEGGGDYLVVPRKISIQLFFFSNSVLSHITLSPSRSCNLNRQPARVVPSLHLGIVVKLLNIQSSHAQV